MLAAGALLAGELDVDEDESDELDDSFDELDESFEGVDESFEWLDEESVFDEPVFAEFEEESVLELLARESVA